MSGTLPFIEDSTGEKFKRQKYKEQSFVELKERGSRDIKEHTPTTALSYDEVNDDLDELVALRGEGRYFGVTDPDDESGISRQSLGPLCANCTKEDTQEPNVQWSFVINVELSMIIMKVNVPLL